MLRTAPPPPNFSKSTEKHRYHCRFPRKKRAMRAMIVHAWKPPAQQKNTAGAPREIDGKENQERGARKLKREKEKNGIDSPRRKGCLGLRASCERHHEPRCCRKTTTNSSNNTRNTPGTSKTKTQKNVEMQQDKRRACASTANNGRALGINGQRHQSTINGWQCQRKPFAEHYRRRTTISQPRRSRIEFLPPLSPLTSQSTSSIGQRLASQGSPG